MAPAFVFEMRCEGLTAFAPAAPDSPLSLVTAVSGTSTPEHPGFYRAVTVSAVEAAPLGEVDASPSTAEESASDRLCPTFRPPIRRSRRGPTREARAPDSPTTSSPTQPAPCCSA
nr:hypothetical protein GCM10025699_01010 [Microbacterium flavescens]